MTPELAKSFADIMLMNIERESATTKRVIAAIPEDQGDYKPSDKNMSAIDLAWHLAASEIWFLTSVADGAFNPGGQGRPENIQKPSDVLAFYEANFASALQRCKDATPEHLASDVSFYGVFNFAAALYLNFSQVHSIHHRGQLSVYLRPMGAKVPAIYGGSADEPFQASAQA